MDTSIRTKSSQIILPEILSLFALVGILFAIVYGSVHNYKPEQSKKVMAQTTEQPSIFGIIAAKPIYADPKTIVIESVQINAAIVPLGVDKDGSLDVPESWTEAGWYKDGANPGEKGNMIINGHYDDNFGRPAAFWGLKNVHTGDKVSIVDRFGRKYEYQITSQMLVGINDPNRSKIYDDGNGAEITLITCGGVWIPGIATYDKRLVLKGSLIR